MRFVRVALLLCFFSFSLLAQVPEWPAKAASAKELKENATFMGQVELRMKFAAANRSVPIFSELMIPLLRHFENFTPDLLEEIARDKKIELYFVADPNLPAGMEVVGLNDEKPRKFFVWIGVNGEKERDEKLHDLKLPEKQNLENLKKAGWITLPKRAKPKPKTHTTTNT